MKFGSSFFHSKVAQRIFFLFILCALLPITILSILSYSQVSKQLKAQNIRRLQNAAKAHGMSIFEKFLFLETNLHLLLSNGIVKTNFSKQLTENFDTIGTINKDGTLNTILGHFNTPSDDFINRALKIKTGITSIFFEHNASNQAPAEVYMLIKNIFDNNKFSVLVGKTNINHLWGIGYDNMLPPLTGLGIVDQYKKLLISSFPITKDIVHKMTMKSKGINIRSFSYKDNGNTYFISYWPLFLKTRFDAPGLNIILRNSSSEALMALSQFKKTFPLVILLTILIILLLSIVQIKKSLVPLEKIKDGVLRVADQDFKNRVIVRSNDEFEDVANSFNAMSDQLDRQFNALMTRSKIDRAILSSLSTIKIINIVLKRMLHFFSCDSTSINLMVEKKINTFHSYTLNNLKVRKPHEEFFDISSENCERLSQDTGYMLIHRKNNDIFYSVIPRVQAGESFLILPLFFDDKLKGTIVLGCKKEETPTGNELKQARQIADQVMVALSNSSLVEELEKLNLGALEALARTVDAKSAWTAGHSERVTILTLKIARVMGLSLKEIEILQRAAYLHDIGKIGIPLAILDKPGRLTDDEFNTIKDHPLIGEKILEPIKSYKDVIPIVSQHHEKFNGKGYPYGLSGEDIVLGARIMAVADVFDAVVSDRPYRNGWVEEKAIKMIIDESGNHFDPKVVDAFLTVI